VAALYLVPEIHRNDKVITLRYGCLREGFPNAYRAGKNQARHAEHKDQTGAGGLIDRAAELSGRSRTDFVLDAARRAAEDALLDRTVFAVDPKAYAEFVARLDAPPRPNPRLRRSLKTPAPWEK
jgi:uncharacterized protein (DUF1778 family)